MLRQQLSELFEDYDLTTRQLLAEVIELEQRYISMMRPRGIYDDIDDLITQIAHQELERNGQREG
jgi:hypothetical protein